MRLISWLNLWVSMGSHNIIRNPLTKTMAYPSFVWGEAHSQTLETPVMKKISGWVTNWLTCGLEKFTFCIVKQTKVWPTWAAYWLNMPFEDKPVQERHIDIIIESTEFLTSLQSHLTFLSLHPISSLLFCSSQTHSHPFIISVGLGLGGVPWVDLAHQSSTLSSHISQ